MTANMRSIIMNVEVRIKPYDKVYDNQLIKLSVAEDQLPYIATIEDLLFGRIEGWTYNIIFFNDKVVGFFNIDNQYSKRYQGKGIGSASMKQLKEYVSNNYHGWKSLVLTVNCRNEVAYKLYT